MECDWVAHTTALGTADALMLRGGPDPAGVLMDAAKLAARNDQHEPDLT
jgi:hypothetical protein